MRQVQAETPKLTALRCRIEGSANSAARVLLKSRDSI